MQEQLSTGVPTTVNGKILDAYDLKTVAKLTGFGLNTIYIHARGKDKDGNPNFPNMIYLGKKKLIPRQDFINYYGYDPNPERNKPTEKVAKYKK